MVEDLEVDQMLRRSLASAPIGVLLLDEAARFTYANPVLLDWIGRKSADFIGRTVFEVTPPFMPPETTKIVGNRARQRVKTGEPITGVECELIDSRGRPFPIFYSASGIRDDEGRVIGEVVFLIDNKARKRDERLRKRYIEAVLKAQEDERRRLARELHDETGSALTSIILALRALDQVKDAAQAKAQLQKVQEIVERTLQDVSLLAHGLHPIALEQLGFAEAVKQYADEYSSVNAIKIDVHVGDVQDSLDDNMALALYRIMQEALTNVAKHANAANASVVVGEAAGQIRMVIADDGGGLPDLAGRESIPPGIGLVGIQERLDLLGGSCEFESSNDAGTTLFVNIPVLGDR